MMTSTISEAELDVDLLKELFPKNRIHDASNNSIEKIVKTIDLCKKIPDLIVIVKRNEMTNPYFVAIEMTTQEKFVNISMKASTVIINGDNYLWFKARCTNVIPAIRQLVENSTECIVCKEKSNEDIQFFKCNCTANLCFECFQGLKKKCCPICNYAII